MNCGKQVFFQNGKLYIQHDNGVDCIELVIPAKQGLAGPRGQSAANFGLNITSSAVAGDGSTSQTLTATPSSGLVGAYTYAFALVSRDTVAGQIDPVLAAPVGNTIVVSNPAIVDIWGLIRVRATHTLTGAIQDSEFMVHLPGIIA